MEILSIYCMMWSPAINHMLGFRVWWQRKATIWDDELKSSSIDLLMAKFDYVIVSIDFGEHAIRWAIIYKTLTFSW